MKPSLNLRDLAGWLALLGMLALSSPGVTIVRAEGGDRASLAIPPPGPSCQVGEEARRGTRRALSVDLSRLIANRTPRVAPGIVALDTEGYRYEEQPPRGPGDASVSVVVVPLE